MWSLVFSLVAVILTSITAVFSILAYAKVVGMEKSTHKIQFEPIPEADRGPTGPELVKKMNEMYEGY